MSKIKERFKKVVVAVDITKESDQVCQAAHRFASAFGSELYLLHVVEPLVMAYNDNLFVDFTPLETQLEEEAKKHLKRLSHAYGIKAENQYVLIGKPVAEIHAFAEKIKADLVVIGTHGRHGISLILGSTANGVLHGSKCDVLAVRIKDVHA